MNKFPLYILANKVSIFFTLFVIFMGLALFTLTLRYNTVGSPFTILTRKTARQQFNSLNHNLRMIFHINKNTLYTITKLAEQSKIYFDKKPQIVYENITHIQNIAQKSFDTLVNTLSMLDDVQVEKSDVNLKECIINASSIIPEDICFEFNYASDDIIIKSSFSHINEVFVNLFKNSIETIQLKKNTNGKITVDLYTETKYAVVNVLDNGLGIKKNEIRKIFSMLYSTKHNSKNWGIGLGYVQKVVSIYNGYIYVKSKQGEYCIFQIILPI